jgi:hypothetical protein
VILAAEGDGVLRPVEEGGRCLLRGEDLVPLPLALAVGHVHGRSPEYEEDILHRWEAAGVAVTSVLLGLALLRGGAAVVLFEHIALLEGVVDRRLVVRAGFLQHIVEYPRASRGCSRTPSSWVNSKGFDPVVVAPLLARLAAQLLALLSPLMLLLGLLGLAALRGRVVHALALLPVVSSPEAKLVAMSNSSESRSGLHPSSRTRSRQFVPSRKACTISDWATLGSSVQRLEKRRMKS